MTKKSDKEAQEKRAKELRKVIDDLKNGKPRNTPKTPREFTEEAARKNKKH